MRCASCGAWVAKMDGRTAFRPPHCTGDYLYVRETFTIMRDMETGNKDIFYAANKLDHDTVSTTYLCDDDGFDTGKPFPWKPSIHMPKEAARIFLKITGVRAEQLQDMNYFDYLKEGLPYKQFENDLQADFIKLWDSTIKKQDFEKYDWNSNPWVWVYEFERVIPYSD
jgi:predicted RNA-binding Zn-ribbon protein involved in translation (DUF1610 family)